jgi:hypothetical protein
MPFYRHFSRRQSLAMVVVLGFLAAATPAFAGGPVGEKTYADSFGNLVIHSPSGFKRILVGKGYLADAHAGPKVVHLEEDRGRLYLRERRPCRYGALLHGRSYMYGLPDNVVPVPTVSCR